MKKRLQSKDRKEVQLERHFPSIDTEGLAISELRDYPMIIWASRGTKEVHGLQVRPRRFLQGELEQLLRPGRSVNFFRSQVIFLSKILHVICDLNLLIASFTALPFLSPLFPATFYFSNLQCLLRFSYCLLFSSTLDPSSLCVNFSSYGFLLITLSVLRFTFVRLFVLTL